MFVVEAIIIILFIIVESKYVILMSISFLAFFYNNYAPAKFFKIQDYFFGEKIVFLTSIGSSMKHLEGRLPREKSILYLGRF